MYLIYIWHAEYDLRLGTIIINKIVEYSTIRKAYLRQSNKQLVGSMQM